MATNPQVELGWDNSALNAGAAQAASTVQSFEKKASQAFDKLKTTKFDLGGFSGQLFAAVGAIGGLKSIGDEFDHILDQAQRLNVAPESLQRVGFQAKLSGSDLDTLVKALFKLNRELRDADNPKAAAALKELGISARQFLSLPLEQQIELLAQRYQEAEAKGQGFTAVFDLLGKNAGDLLPLLRQNIDALREMGDIDVLTEEQLNRIGEFNDRMDKALQKAKAWTADGILTMADGLALFGRALQISYEDQISYNDALRQAVDEMAQVKLETEEAAEAETKRLKALQESAAAEAEAARVSKEAADQDKKNQAARKERDEEKKRTKEAAAPNTLTKLENARKDVLEAEQKLIEAQGLTYEELFKLEIELEKAKQRQIQLEKQYYEEGKRREEQQKREAENEKKKAEEAAKEQKKQAESLDFYKQETAIIEEQNDGHKKKADAMERNLKIAREAKELMEQAGVSEAEALALAKQRVDAEEKAEKAKDKNERKKIQGYKQSQGRARDFAGLDNVTFPGLQNRDRLQDRTQPAFPSTGGKAYPPTSDDRYTGLVPKPKNPAELKQPNTGIARNAQRTDAAETRSLNSSALGGPRDLQADMIRILSSIDESLRTL